MMYVVYMSCLIAVRSSKYKCYSAVVGTIGNSSP